MIDSDQHTGKKLPAWRGWLSKLDQPLARWPAASPQKTCPPNPGPVYKLGSGQEIGYTSGGLKLDQAQPLQELEQENARLKRSVADLALDKAIIQEALRGR